MAETHRTFTFFRILSQIETSYISSTQSVEATTSCDPVKGTDFLTCLENKLVQKHVFTHWLSFGGQGGRVIVGLVGGPFMMEEQLMLNQTSGGAAGDGGAVGDGCQTLLLPG